MYPRHMFPGATSTILYDFDLINTVVVNIDKNQEQPLSSAAPASTGRDDRETLPTASLAIQSARSVLGAIVLISLRLVSLTYWHQRQLFVADKVDPPTLLRICADVR